MQTYKDIDEVSSSRSRSAANFVTTASGKKHHDSKKNAPMHHKAKQKMLQQRRNSLYVIGRQRSMNFLYRPTYVIMAALWNRAGHYILQLWFLSSFFFLLSFFFLFFLA